VNYDLPWNPQRIEQRIGRCHRYGQKHDVVVVNFLNRNNEADQRVYELLAEKFQLFEGVFGASDEVLGAIESGVDLERRIHDIYQRCRKTEEIKSAFDRLQLELSFEIDETMSQARRKLLEHFDDEVREKLRVRDADTKAVLGRFEQLLMQLTQHELRAHAEFASDSSFRLNANPFGGEIALGLYELPRRSGEAHLYRLGHPLADAVIARAKARELPDAEIHFDYAEHTGKVSILEPLCGSSGFLAVAQLSVESLDQQEDHLVFAAVADSGEALDDEVARRLLSLPGQFVAPLAAAVPESVELAMRQRQAQIQQGISARNAEFFEAETEKLESWADDLKTGLEREIKELERQIKDARRAAKAAALLEDKLAAQKQIKALESQRNEKRRSLFDAQDAVDAQREVLIASIEAKLAQKAVSTPLFTVRWSLGRSDRSARPDDGATTPSRRA
jgi:adenine-specific DNA-methyltransferase